MFTFIPVSKFSALLLLSALVNYSVILSQYSNQSGSSSWLSLRMNVVQVRFWTVAPADFPSPGYPAARSYYFIKSRLNGLVMDVEGENRNPGARVVMWNQKSGACDNQLWCDDYATGTIRSKLNDFCLDWDGKHTLHCTAQHTRRHPAHNFIIVSANVCNYY